MNVVYLRFNTTAGHIGIFKYSDNELKFQPEFELQGVKFTVKKCEGDELINFWKDHGSHFEMCVGKNKKITDRKGKRGKRVDPNELKKEVKLGDETFDDLSKVKTRMRRILSTSKDGEKISSPDHEFIYDLLKNHRNFDTKSKDLSYFTTGKHDEHDYSRCFFIVKTDGTKEDFSVHKCIERFGNDHRKNK